VSSFLHHDRPHPGSGRCRTRDTQRLSSARAKELRISAFADEIIASQSEFESVSPDGWYERLAAQHDQLQDDLRRLKERDVERGLRLAAIIWPYWVARGHLAEGRTWLTELLARTPAEPPTFDRTKALYGAAILAFLQGDADDARRLLDESLTAARELGERALEADGLIGLARVAVVDGDPVEMERRARESADAARAAADERRLGTALHHVAEALRRQGRYEDALPFYRDAIERHRALGDRRSVALELHNLGHTARQTGERDAASDRLRESLALAAELKHERLVGYCLLDFAGLAAGEREPARAARLVGASDALFAAIGAALDPEYREERELVHDASERALGREEFEREYEAGAALAQAPDRLTVLRQAVS
jgi:tetratricopeptide (TPR) repeat protein